MKQITKQQLLDAYPCSDGRVFLLQHRTLKSAWLACDKSEWMIWALYKTGLLDDRLARTFAIKCAEHVLHLFEETHPNDKRPRLAIQAGQDFLDGKISEDRLAAARDAAWAAWDAARAAWDAARDAAGAAAWAARAAARDAAGAAAGAAWAAAWAAESKWQADELRKLINPFQKTPAKRKGKIKNHDYCNL